jgi:Htaa
MATRSARFSARLAIALALMVAFAVVAVGSASAHSGTLKLVGDKTKLVTDPATTKVLLDAGIVPQPVGPTGFDVPPRNKKSVRYSFPITGGTVDAATLAGTIDHSGGIDFVNTNNGSNLLLTNFRIEIDADPGLTAAVGGTSLRVRILDLDLSRAKVIAKGRTIRVKNVDASLTADAAAALNASLGVSFFAPGIELGTAQVFARI